MLLQEPVQSAIWHCLNHYDFKDAVFLSERLCAEIESDETIFMLATSYYRANQLHQAYWLLREKGRLTPECRFLQARCAYDLKKYSEAESALTHSCFGDPRKFDEIVREFGEIACFVFQLIAQICVKTERPKIAAEALKRALKLNPFLWQAFADLCHLGENVDVAGTFQIASTEVFSTCQANSNANAMILPQDIAVAAAAWQQQLPNDYSMLNNSNSYVLSTPIDQIQNLNALQHLNTPNNNNASNNNNLNSSITLLRGGGGGGGNNTGPTGLHQTSGMMLLDDTPLGGYVSEQQQQQQQMMTTASGAAAPGFNGGAGTPFRKQFKYLSMVSPTTPSFGIMPLSSPCSGGDSPLITGGGGGGGIHASAAHLNLTNSPLPQQTLAEVNQEQKIIAKKVKGGHVGCLINRKDNAVPKPAVFTQTGNITPRTPNNNNNNQGNLSPNAPNAAVRRSSRLFCNNAYSVKENNKSPNIGNKFAQPRSPPRKTKARGNAKICLNNELIEEKSSNVNRKDKERIETVTTAGVGSGGGGGIGGGNRNISAEDSKVLLNNSLNNAQTMAHQVLLLKKQSADGLMALLRELGEGYKHLAHYQCKAAIKHLEKSLPKHHLKACWVQSVIGVSQYELAEYEAAVATFQRIHETEPHRLDYMEIYSSSLWQLQREVELSALSQDCVNQNRLSPVTWCVAGNCFSLHKEHETAIKYFKRAVQVDPDFVYSYTLLGHELVLTEELDKALNNFRSAIIRDSRHYNAWFGIGTIYSKQEKYDLAELHYIRALKINPQNAVILVHIGAMQFFMQKKELALQTLNTAATLDPKNSLARFHRGSIYFSLGKHEEALRELEELKEIVPKESVVFYLIGKIHKTLGNVDLALMHFSWATDLDPKGANNQIKDAFDSMSHPNLNEPSPGGDPNDTPSLGTDDDELIFDPTRHTYDNDAF